MNTTTNTAARRFVTFTVDGAEYECAETAETPAAPVAYAADGGADGHNGAYWTAVERVACSRCLSSGGRTCVKPNGDATVPHAARVARAERLGFVVGR